MIYVGDHVLALRQSGDLQFAGVTPKGRTSSTVATLIEYKPYAGSDGIIRYHKVGDATEKTLQEGGLFDLGDGKFPVILREVRSTVALGDISVVIGDRANATHDIDVTLSGVQTPGRLLFARPVYVLPSQHIQISSAAGGVGFVDIYVVKAND